MSNRPALFLDRDGVINVDHGHIYRRDDFEFIDGIFELVACATKAGYIVLIITNQAGIGRGYYTEEDFYLLMDWVRAMFLAKHGLISGVYFCPFHPQHGIGKYRKVSFDRKPGPGMLCKAIQDFELDRSRSVLIGDKPSDIQAGQSAGIATLLYIGLEPCGVPSIPISCLQDAMPYLDASCS